MRIFKTFVAVTAFGLAVPAMARSTERDGHHGDGRDGIETFYGDINCDGRREEVTFHRGSGYWTARNPRGRDEIIARWNARAHWQHLMLADVNGDRCDDLVGMSEEYPWGHWWVTESSSWHERETRLWDTFALRASTGGRIYWRVYARDYDRDGLDDLVADNNYGETWVAYSDGYRFHHVRVR